MTHSNTSAAKLLVENLSLLQALPLESGVLDLASGRGRNGRFLVARGIPVTFVDRDAGVLAEVEEATQECHELVRTRCVDLEEPGTQVLSGMEFDAVLVFNYLHRPLFPVLRRMVRQGGLIFYETFTTQQRRYGRPKNPGFLLQPGELEKEFEDWQLLHSFEGILPEPERAVANLIARRI